MPDNNDQNNMGGQKNTVHRAPDPNTVGQDRARKTIVEAHDADHGVYTENVTVGPTAEPRLPTTQLPKAPDPSPFTLGPTGGGGGPAPG